MKAEVSRLSVCNTTSSSNPSSSHSPSVCGEQFDVKVEITPPQPSDQAINPQIMTTGSLDSSPGINTIPKSISSESASTLTVSDYQSKTTSNSPSQRKLSEIHEYAGLLGAMTNTMGARLNPNNPSPTPSATTQSSRLFKRIEEMIDLSSPYNHYKCLSPSETNLSQYMDARALAFTHRTETTNNKPGSGRLLRRQFSLDKGISSLQSMSIPFSPSFSFSQTDDAAALQQSYRARQFEKAQADATAAALQKQLQQQENAATKNQSTSNQRMHKQHSISTAQDLEKIEENPISPKTLNNSAASDDIHDADAALPTNSNNERMELKLNVDSLVQS